MNKVMIPIAAVVALGAVGFVNKDAIYEKYLQTQVNKNLVVDKGMVGYCGHIIEDTETPKQLVERVKNQFNGAASFRKIVATSNEVLADTDEIEKINKKISDWGWQSDEYLAERIADYKNMSYMKDSLEEYLAIQKHRQSVEYTKEELITERDALRDAVYISRKQELEGKISQLVDQFSCELDDESFESEKYVIFDSLDRALQDEKKAEFEALHKERAKLGLVNAVEPLESFTNKFYKFLNDAVAEIKIIDSSTSVEDFRITNVLTVASTSPLGKKQRYDVGCEAYSIGVNPIFGSASVSNCFFRKSGETFGERIYLYDLQIMVEDYNNEEQWDKARKAFLEKLD
ncbi:TPA: hypothetical protein NG644_001441 [Vibrio parahaemolyticus]|nr:hypothetical protein [Vibrio parahaemolyticus]